MPDKITLLCFTVKLTKNPTLFCINSMKCDRVLLYTEMNLNVEAFSWTVCFLSYHGMFTSQGHVND